MELSGSIYYDTKEQKWIGTGKGWWLGKSEGNRIKVLFENPFELEKANTFRIITSPLCGLCEFEVQNITTGSFELVCISYQEQLCKVAFVVTGEQSEYYFDDRNLSNDQNVEDIYASSLLLNYEAPYGFIGVMGSASIKSREELEQRKKLLQNTNNQLKMLKENDQSIVSNNELDERIKLNDIRIKRQTSLNEGVKYYESAQKFGQLWGKYCTGEQKENLNGCFIPLCTGGGPGIMEAAAKGAREQDAQVIGIDSPFGNEEYFNLKNNCYLYSNIRLRMNNFSIRESILINYAHVILFWPGGYGTVWEVCETLSKLQTKHLRKRRIKAIFVHSDYWQPFFDMVAKMRECGTVNNYGDRIKIPGVDDKDPDDAYVAEVVDSAEEAFEKTKAFVESLAKNGDLILRKES